MRIVASLALYRGGTLPVFTGVPFVRGGFVAYAAQVSVRGDRHGRGRMPTLVWTVAGFTSYTLLDILTGFRVIAGRMAFQA